MLGFFYKKTGYLLHCRLYLAQMHTVALKCYQYIPCFRQDFVIPGVNDPIHTVERQVLTHLRLVLTPPEFLPISHRGA